MQLPRIAELAGEFRLGGAGPDFKRESRFH